MSYTLSVTTILCLRCVGSDGLALLALKSWQLNYTFIVKLSFADSTVYVGSIIRGWVGRPRPCTTPHSAVTPL